jgi:hypothetical protein
MILIDSSSICLPLALALVMGIQSMNFGPRRRAESSARLTPGDFRPTPSDGITCLLHFKKHFQDKCASCATKSAIKIITSGVTLLDDNGRNLSQGEIILAEGYVTGATLQMPTEKPVAFDEGNLAPVAQKQGKNSPRRDHLLCRQ